MSKQPIAKPIAYGHHRRAKIRQQKIIDVTNNTKQLCDKLFKALLEAQKSELCEIQIYVLYDEIYRQLSKVYSGRLLTIALKARSAFFNTINHQCKKDNLPLLPLPVVAYEPKRPTNTNDLATFLYHTTAKTIVDNAINTWKTQETFNLIESVTWLLFSLISFAGYNEAELLEPIYYAIKDDGLLVFNEGCYGFVIDISSDSYGNQRLVSIDAMEHAKPKNSVSYSRLIILDDISLMWYLYVKNSIKNIEQSFPTFRECLILLLQVTGEKTNKSHKNIDIPNINSWTYLKNIHIYWQTQQGVSIDTCLVQTRLGKQRHTTINKSEWLNYLNPTLPKFFNINNNDLSELKINITLNNNNYLTSTSNSQSYKSDIVLDIKRALKDKKLAKQTLENLHPQLPENGQILVCWLLDLLVDGNAISTLQRYLSEIGNDFIWATRDVDFRDWQSYDYEYIYEKIILNKHQIDAVDDSNTNTTHKVNKIGYTQTVLLSLHKTLKKHFNAPDIRIQKQTDPLIVKATLIPSTLYHHIIFIIDNQTTLTPLNQLLLKVIISLLYRTGMRISEILGLKVTDVEYDSVSLNHFSVIVRNNEHRQLKSDDGTRRICLSALLTSSEKEWFRKLFLLKRQQNSKFIFSLDYRSKPIHYYGIEQVLRQVKYGNKPLTAHAFRHNAISVMAMILRCDAVFVQAFSDYDESQINGIKTHFLGKTRKLSPNYWHALMSFAGHADLNTTFSSYIHTADLIASHQLSFADHQLPIALVSKLTGIRRENFNRNHPNVADFTSDKVKLNQIRHKLARKLHLIPTKANKRSSHKANIQDISTLSNHQAPIKQSKMFGNYALMEICELFSQLEDGKSLIDSCGTVFDYADAKRLYDNARALVLTNNKPNHKLIGKARKPKSNHPLIAPTPLHYKSEIALSYLCFENMDKLWQTEKDKKELKWFLETFYKKVTCSKSEIRFTIKDKSDFYRYLTITLRILPGEYWRISLNIFSTAKANNPKKIGKHLQKLKDEFNKKFPNLKLSNNTNGYSGYTISIIRPNKKDKVNNKQPSSGLLKYIGHWGLIVIL